MDEEQAAKRHKELIENGWIWRFTGEDPRMSELRESYESLGMEVILEPGVLGNEGECRSCFTVEGYADKCTTIYTRGDAKESGRSDDDLF
jgi:hypothetical protein